MDCWEASAGNLGLEFVHGKSVESVYFWLNMKSLQRPLLRLGMGGNKLWNAVGKIGALGDASATGAQENPVSLSFFPLKQNYNTASFP